MPKAYNSSTTPPLHSAHPNSARRRSFKLPKTRTIRSESAIDALLDEIKDEIDRLHEIAKGKRKEAAQDLIDYLTCHHVEYA